MTFLSIRNFIEKSYPCFPATPVTAPAVAPVPVPPKPVRVVEVVVVVAAIVLLTPRAPNAVKPELVPNPKPVVAVEVEPSCEVVVEVLVDLSNPPTPNENPVEVLDPGATPRVNPVL